jgi:ATPase subunit of ABC transporter with duplicated ATPase domains
VGAITVSHVSWRRPGGATLLDDVSFHAGDGERVALIGANGVGKTTLLRLITGDETGQTGTITVDGHLGVMHQLVGHASERETVRDLLVATAPARVQSAAVALADAEAAMAERPDDTGAALAYAHALSDWGEVGGYEAETFWDACTTRALGRHLDEVTGRPLASCSGGEQKRLALESLLHGEHDVLLLDEPDNFLDVEGKRWLEDELRRSPKTILYVSHDRELLAATASKIVTVEAKGAWTHGGSFAGYHDARAARLDRLEQQFELHRRERDRLVGIVRELKQRARYSDSFAPKAKAAESRLRHFDERGAPPERVKDQQVTMRLRGARTGRKALTIERLELYGLTDPFDAEIWYGERVAVLGPNGAGKSHLLRLLAGDETVEHEGEVTLGARVVPGFFRQTHDHPELRGRTLLDILERRDVIRGPAMGALRRYELEGCAEQWFETLSGGQQARFLILLLELAGATMLLLDEPTDNLDLVSAEALEDGLAGFEGTVLAVTHDRWFLRGFDRFIVLDDDGSVADLLEPPARYR